MYRDGNSKNIGYPSQLAIFLGLTGGALVLGSLLTVVLWKMMTGQPLLSMEADMANPKYYNAVMIMQGVSTFVIFFLPAYFFAMICYRNHHQFLGFDASLNRTQILIVIGILIFTFPMSGALAELNKIIPISQNLAEKFKAMELERKAIEEALIKIDSVSKYLLSLLVIALLPALFEETYFRGGMQNFLTKWFKGPWVAIIITSIIFSFIHMSYYGFLVRLALGVVLGLVFYYSKNLWLPILLHFLFNGVQVTALYIMHLAGVKDKKDIEEAFPIWAGAIAIAMLIYLFILFRKHSQKVKRAEPDDDRVEDDDFLRWTNS